MQTYTGTTIHQYLLQYRLEIAKKILLNTDCTISDIALKCGFKNVYYFSNTFKEKTGITPSLFRKTKRNSL